MIEVGLASWWCAGLLAVLQAFGLVDELAVGMAVVLNVGLAHVRLVGLAVVELLVRLAGRLAVG